MELICMQFSNICVMIILYERLISVFSARLISFIKVLQAQCAKRLHNIQAQYTHTETRRDRQADGHTHTLTHHCLLCICAFQLLSVPQRAKKDFTSLPVSFKMENLWDSSTDRGGDWYEEKDKLKAFVCFCVLVYVDIVLIWWRLNENDGYNETTDWGVCGLYSPRSDTYRSVRAGGKGGRMCYFKGKKWTGKKKMKGQEKQNRDSKLKFHEERFLSKISLDA